jgi:hypothetical protein
VHACALAEPHDGARPLDELGTLAGRDVALQRRRAVRIHAVENRERALDDVRRQRDAARPRYRFDLAHARGQELARRRRREHADRRTRDGADTAERHDEQEFFPERDANVVGHFYVDARAHERVAQRRVPSSSRRARRT